MLMLTGGNTGPQRGNTCLPLATTLRPCRARSLREARRQSARARAAVAVLAHRATFPWEERSPTTSGGELFTQFGGTGSTLLTQRANSPPGRWSSVGRWSTQYGSCLSRLATWPHTKDGAQLRRPIRSWTSTPTRPVTNKASHQPPGQQRAASRRRVLLTEEAVGEERAERRGDSEMPPPPPHGPFSSRSHLRAH